MQSITTQKHIGAVLRPALMLVMLFFLSMGGILAQPYINGNLSTGTTNLAGTLTAPAGFTFSELQPGLNTIGTQASIEANNALADDFTVPAGLTWDVTTMEFFAYSTGYAGATSPFDEVHVRIYDTDPSVGTPTPIFGDMTTNRLASTESAMMYRISGSSTAGDMTARQIWKITANVPLNLTAGTYWVEWRVGVIAGVTSNFTPPSTVVGTTTQPGNNAKFHNIATNAWEPLLDLGFPQDLHFVVNYTSGCSGTPPTVTVSPNTGLCGPVTLTASGADTYTWSPAAGLNTTTGATVTAAPTTATTYTVTGVTSGCAASVSVTVGAGASNAVLDGVAPSTVHLEEGFDTGVPATWATANTSDVVGTVPTWITGVAGIFPAHSGAPTSYILSTFNSADATGSVISNWVITPQITTISNGDVLSFWTRTVTPGTTVFPDRMEVRMSTAGASTNVGATHNDVGDFTTLLLTVNPDLNDTDYPSEWTRYEVTISGLGAPVSGRFAFRHYVTDGGPNGTNSDNIGVDDVRFETPQSCVAPGSTQNIFVNITGGTGPFTVVYNDGVANQTVNGYISGENIAVTPTSSSTYTLVSVTDANDCAAAATSGSFTVAVSGPPVITTQPEPALNVCENGSDSLIVVSPGNAYQWQVSLDNGITWSDVTDGPNYSGATNDTLILLDVPASWSNYMYQVIVTSPCSTQETSTSSTITVSPAATIDVQPAPVTVCSGSPASFSVTATGATAYQWEVSEDGGATWTALTGETSDNLTLPSVTIMENGYQYRVLVSGSCGDPIPSDAAVLLVDESTVITTQPIAIAACVGNSAIFSVIATGSANTYQWQESQDNGITWTDIAGATSASFSTPAVTGAMDGYMYQVVINNPCGAPVISNPATLNITAAATIDTEPVDATVCEGSPASFTVVATGATSYQWQISTDGGATFTQIAGETGPTLNIPTPTASQSGTVYNVLVGSCGAPLTSVNATLTVNDVAAITTQPANTSACEAGTATFTVATTGSAVTYQWQVSTDGGATWTDVAGETNASITLNNVASTQNDDQYRVVVSNPCTPGLTSDAATLTVSATATITDEPDPVTVCDGGAAAFTVVATGATAYQWQVSTDGGTTFTDISGETNATLNLAAVTTNDNANIYHVVITSCGATPLVSADVTLTVNEVETFTTQPVNTTICDGADGSFTVAATGGATTYQWQVSTDGGVTWTDMAGETNATLNLTGVTGAMDGNQYRAVMNGACATDVNSDVATLTVSSGPTITAQPADTEACESGDASFTVTADATTYQWEVSTDGGTTWTAVSGATNATIDLTAVAASNDGDQYRVVAGNDCGTVTSNAVTLTVTGAPDAVITADVTTVGPGESATLTATPAGATYQWFHNGTAVPGATGETLIVTSAQAGDYYVEVTNASGCSDLSNTITITATTTNFAFITPNANNGMFRINFRNEGFVNAGRVVTIYDTKGSLVHKQVHTANLANPVDVIQVNVPHLPGGIYFLMLSEENGKRLQTGQLIVQ